ncbi:MAG: hypothetical protein AAFV77_03115, partial [Planctomycetota bacterium]
MAVRRSAVLQVTALAVGAGVVSGVVFGALTKALLPAIAGLVLGVVVAYAIHGTVVAARASGVPGKLRDSKPLLVIQKLVVIQCVFAASGVLLLGALVPMPVVLRAVLAIFGIAALGLGLIFLSVRWNADVESPDAQTPEHRNRSIVCLQIGLIVLDIATATAIGNWVVPQATGSNQTVLASLAGLDAKLDKSLQNDTRIEAKIDEVVDTLFGRNQALQSELRDTAIEAETLRVELRHALERLARFEADAGRDPLKRLEVLRQEGNAADLISFLDEQIAADQRHLVAKHHERAAVAYTIGQIDKAEASWQTILALIPDDLNATNRMGHVHLLRGKLDDAELPFAAACHPRSLPDSSSTRQYAN